MSAINIGLMQSAWRAAFRLNGDQLLKPGKLFLVGDSAKIETELGSEKVLLEPAVRVLFVVGGPVDLPRTWIFDEPKSEKVPVGGDFRGRHPALLNVAVQIIPYMCFDATKDAPAEIALPGPSKAMRPFCRT